MRTLHQLADDEGDRFPAAAQVLRENTYIDDILGGALSLLEAEKLRDQLIQLLALGGFELRKWTSNSAELLNQLPQDHLESPVFLEESQDPHFSILGLHWTPSTDCFSYHLNLPNDPPTKRIVLSVIARIYDPCGFLAPCIMLAKCLMQLLWTTGLNWDDPLPQDLAEKWQTFVLDTKALSSVHIPRSFQLSRSALIEIHGFSDASEAGYAGVVYFRCELSSGETFTRLVISKTRVAPLKRVTLPRLELCAAQLVAQLASHCNAIYKNKINISRTVLWCDSSVTLSWLQTPSYRLKTYVANRVANTQELFPYHCWRFVPSQQNPADVASRGILPSHLLDHPLWWNGPQWLSQSSEHWPINKFTPANMENLEEIKQTPLTVLTSIQPPEWDILTKFSSWTKLTRVMGYVLRFIHNSKGINRRCGHLSSSELKTASLTIVKCLQASSFADDITRLQRQECSAPLRRLCPFLDSNGILRVGGRLKKSSLAYDVKHPVLLPRKHHIVNLIVDYYHHAHLHSGPQLTQAIISQQYWIISARQVIRSRIFRCLRCFKNKPKNTSPLMGELPSARITPARPFNSTGVDYCGPFTVKIVNLRALRHIKVYICVFVCLVTKAVHLEVVTDLTSEAFIASLTRFVSRRGFCADIYSDCGTNFVGADASLQRTVQAVLRSSDSKIFQFTTNKEINFHFNPPAAPHQGGLWEAAVKGAKHHLRRVMGDTVLTLMEFITLSTQIEAMLNSRPLTPLSTDPNDCSALTPSHFLIGAPLTSLPEADHTDVPVTRLKQWHLVQALHQRIWKRWQLEYLHTLQQRTKWSSSTENLKVGDLVLIHMPSPPLTWPLARVTRLYPGSDGVVRVVDLKTSTGHLTRPVVKVFPLPID